MLKPPKNGDAHEVAMSPSLIATLQSLPRETDQFVFRDENGKRLTYDRVRHRFETDLKHSGFKRIGLHGFSHGLVTHLQEMGVSLLDSMAQTGHRSVTAHSRYRHANLKMQRQNIMPLMFQVPADAENVFRLNSQRPLP